MKHIILAITFIIGFQIASGQVSNEHLDAYLWEYPLQQGLVIDPELMQEMLAEIQRIIDSGDLFFRPLPNDFADQVYDHYFLYLEPGRILKTIAMAYPYLDSGMQETLRTMVLDLFADPVHRPWAAGQLPLDAGKERKPFAPETLWGEGSNFGLFRPTIQNVYNIWLYVYRTGHIEAITPAYYSQISGFYNSKLGSSDRGRLYGSMKAHIGMARLAHLFEDDDLYETARNALLSALNFGLVVNDVDTLASRGHSNAYWDGAYRYLYEWHPANPPWPNMRNWDWVNRNYIFHNISPEIGRYLQDYLSAETEARHSFMMNRFPMWWLREAPYFNRWTGDEGIGIPGSSFGTNVPLERWFRNVDAGTLASYMVSSPVGVADSYWMEALIMAIEANATDQWVDVRSTAFELDLAEDDPTPVEYFLTVEVIGQGHVEVDGAVYADPLLVEEGTELTLEAYPVGGWQFDGWSGDLSGAASTQTIVMDGHKDVTATFSEIPPVEYFLTVEIIGQGHVEVDGALYADPLLLGEGTELTLEAYPDENRQFMKWIHGHETVWIEPELVLTMPGHDIEIAAYFVDASIPQHHDVNNETIADGQTACFGAMISLMVSDFIVEAGGAITLVAARYIQIKPGSHIQNGASLSAYITQSAEFCPEEMIAASWETEKINSAVHISDRETNDVRFKIYPNPSGGLFTLEFDHAGRNEDIQIEIFSVSGGLVYTETIGAAVKHMIDLEGRKPGVYMVRLIVGDGVGHARLVLR